MRHSRRAGRALLVGAVLGLGVARPAVAADQAALDFLSSMEFGGHLHTLASYQATRRADGATDAVSDIHINSLELGLTASPYRFLDANVVWLLEEGAGGGAADQAFAVDQAFVTLSGTPAMLKASDQRRRLAGVPPLYLQAGKFYVPFATDLNYHTFDVVSEPPTLALGETLDSGLRVGYADGAVHAFGGVFGGSGQDGGPNGASIDAADDDLDDYFLGVSVAGAPGKLAVRYISNLNNSLALQEALGRTAAGNATARAETANPGLALYGRTGAGPVTLQASYVAARDAYQYGALAGHRPTAATGELTYRVNHTWEATAVYHHTADWPDRAERGAGAVVGARLAPGLSLAAQYLHRSHDTDLSGTDREQVAALLLDVAFGELFGPLVRNRASAME